MIVFLIVYAETRRKRWEYCESVKPSNAISRNWIEFLYIDNNMVELFSLLATSVTALNTDKQLISTH